GWCFCADKVAEKSYRRLLAGRLNVSAVCYGESRLAIDLQSECSITHHPNVQPVHIGEHADTLHRCDGPVRRDGRTQLPIQRLRHKVAHAINCRSHTDHGFTHNEVCDRRAIEPIGAAFLEEL